MLPQCVTDTYIYDTLEVGNCWNQWHSDNKIENSALQTSSHAQQSFGTSSQFKFLPGHHKVITHFISVSKQDNSPLDQRNFTATVNLL